MKLNYLRQSPGASFLPYLLYFLLTVYNIPKLCSSLPVCKPAVYTYTTRQNLTESFLLGDQPQERSKNYQPCIHFQF